MTQILKNTLIIISMMMSTKCFSIIEMKGKEAKQLSQKIDKEVKHIFLNKSGGTFSKSLVKDGLSKGDIDSWNKLAQEVQRFYENKLQENGTQDIAMRILVAISADIVESIHRINFIYKTLPGEASKAAGGEVQYLKEKSVQATKIGGDQLAFADTERTETNLVDARLVVARFANALQEICNQCIKLIKWQKLIR